LCYHYDMTKKILITGGTGYIGSHTAVELIKSGHEVVIIDNLSNSKKEVLNRIEIITGKRPEFIEADLRDEEVVNEVFLKNNFDAVIHFAGLKAVGESIKKPLEYYENNINSTIVLIRQMIKHDVRNLIFSSSATVYGAPSELPLLETSQTGVGISNPYGWTKYMIEQVLTDVANANPSLNITLLRYFNPIGAHESGLIGEDPNGIPNNLLPFVAQVAVGKMPEVKVFGDDYDTVDGTGVRDYIHVVDLAKGHLAALKNIHSGVSIYNLGTGEGTSVLQIIKEFSKACKKEIPYQIVERREGDVASVYADASKALKELKWKAEKTIEDACRDAWRWQSKNPNGYN